MDNFRLRTAEEECQYILKKAAARFETKKTGEHYLLTSGLHTDTFFQLARVFEKGPLRERLARLMLLKIRKAGVQPRKIDILLGPTMGALPLMYTLQHFYDFERAKVIYAERNEKGEFIIGRGFTVKPDNKILVIDDVVTTFSTFRKTVAAANTICHKKGWDATVVGLACCIDRTSSSMNPPEFYGPAFKFAAGIKIPLESFRADECPSCRNGVPLVRP